MTKKSKYGRNAHPGRISVKEAAERLGVWEETIRQGLRSNTLPIGCAIRTPTGRYIYIIPRKAFEKFEEHGQCSIDELMDKMRELEGAINA
jgi:excisionase family DNA binding protein